MKMLFRIQIINSKDTTIVRWCVYLEYCNVSILTVDRPFVQFWLVEVAQSDDGQDKTDQSASTGGCHASTAVTAGRIFSRLIRGWTVGRVGRRLIRGWTVGRVSRSSGRSDCVVGTINSASCLKV